LKASAGNAVAQQEREGSENIQELPGNVHGANKKSIREQPLTTLR